jgi:hypothetical protein
MLINHVNALGMLIDFSVRFLSIYKDSILGRKGIFIDSGFNNF